MKSGARRGRRASGGTPSGDERRCAWRLGTIRRGDEDKRARLEVCARNRRNRNRAHRRHRDHRKLRKGGRKRAKSVVMLRQAAMRGYSVHRPAHHGANDQGSAGVGGRHPAFGHERAQQYGENRQGKRSAPRMTLHPKKDSRSVRTYRPGKLCSGKCQSVRSFVAENRLFVGRCSTDCFRIATVEACCLVGPETSAAGSVSSGQSGQAGFR